MAGVLYVLIGLPGSGKSYFAKRTIENDNSYAWVSRDAVRYRYVKDQAHYFDHEGDVYREFCKEIDMYLHEGKNVIADATHLTHGSRKKLLNTITEKPDKIIGVWVSTPFQVCFGRNALREGITRVPDQQMYKMKNAFQKPDVRLDNFDYLYFIDMRG